MSDVRSAETDLSEEECAATGHEYTREPSAPVGYACRFCGAHPPVGWYPESNDE